MISEQRKTNMAPTVSEQQKPKTISEYYNEAYALVDQGICFDEIGLRDGALAMYEKGLELIDAAGNLPGCEQNDMYQKMVRAREHIVFRLKDLRSGGSPAESTSTPSPPPPYEAITGALSAMGHSKAAEELLAIPNGVQLFYVKDQETTVPSYPTFLKVFKFVPDSSARRDSSSTSLKGAASTTTTADVSPAFLQVGDWVYPLVPGRSPVLHSSYGAYIFPNPSVDFPDSYVGVILPVDLEPSVLSSFEKLMKTFTAYKEQVLPVDLTPQENQRLASRIATFLIKSSEFVVWGLKEGTERTTDFIRKQSGSIKDKSSQSTVTIDPRVQTSVHYLRQGTKIAVKISGYLVDKVGLLGAKIGKRIASSLQGPSSGSTVVKDVLVVSSAGVAGVSTIWMSLEEVAKTLAKCIANETVSVVDCKYGEQAAEVTDKLLYSAGFAAATAWNIENLGIKAIAKRSAKEASLAYLKDLSEKQDHQSKPPPPLTGSAVVDKKKSGGGATVPKK